MKLILYRPHVDELWILDVYKGNLSNHNGETQPENLHSYFNQRFSLLERMLYLYGAEVIGEFT